MGLGIEALSSNLQGILLSPLNSGGEGTVSTAAASLSSSHFLLRSTFAINDENNVQLSSPLSSGAGAVVYKHSQYFPIISRSTKQQPQSSSAAFLLSSPSFKFLTLRINSNYGNGNYTCLYKVKVHGVVPLELVPAVSSVIPL